MTKNTSKAENVFALIYADQHASFQILAVYEDRYMAKQELLRLETLYPINGYSNSPFFIKKVDFYKRKQND